ncbi:hypothetical protein LTR84_004569 [Exophiala bonariae]|uniref:DUF6536 domain-containing protein n=1 Tax=Exophiala bonariae TaxID=1690606 RepID=A0AAV9NM94_9EURO|nr:hypothetical protein LTR84_004569 [Exophiala bonariae]
MEPQLKRDPVHDDPLILRYRRPQAPISVDSRSTGRESGILKAGHDPRFKSKDRTRKFTDHVDVCFDHLGRITLTVLNYLSAHNPLSGTGRTRLKYTVLRSGPAYQEIETARGASKRGHFTGWRLGALLSCVLLIFCLSIECALLIAANAFQNEMYQEGYQNVLWEGSCTITKRWTTFASLVINFIATLTISSSNYVMQCLSAPSERELAIAHDNGRSLQLGVSSPSNLRWLSGQKVFLWWLLSLSSIPVHLLLNSALFSSLQANNYGIAVLTSDYNDTSLWTSCSPSNSNYNVTLSDSGPWTTLVCSIIADVSTYERLENHECIEQYTRPLLTQRSNVVLVSNVSSSDRDVIDDNLGGINSKDLSYLNFTQDYEWFAHDKEANLGAPESLQNLSALFGIYDALDYKKWRSSYATFLGQNESTFAASGYDPSIWMCERNYSLSCTKDAALQNASNWQVTLANIPIDHCLSSKTNGEVCRLESNRLILWITIGCDVVKIVVILFALCVISDPPLVTIGDSIAIFLKNPEQCTRRRCLVGQDKGFIESNFYWLIPFDVCRGVGDKKLVEIWPEVFGPQSTPWVISTKKWGNAASLQRWFSCILLIGLLFTVGGWILAQGITNMIDLRGSVWTAGLGSINPNAVFQFTTFGGVDPGSSMMFKVLVVNTPQLAFSFLYFLYNGMFTCMHAAEEFAGFATQRKALRVSSPERGQRSTYWLSLPWSYSVPLLLLSSITHWLVSRSIYLVNINVMGLDGNWQPDRDISACGFNNLMILLVMLTLVCMLSLLVACSNRKLDSNIPMVGTSSMIISAVCHHPNDRETEAVKPLLWGVTEKPVDGKPGHCSLSSGEVEHLVPGEIYS